MQQRCRQLGATMAETILVVPVLLMVGLAVLHFGLIAQARSNLDYATLMAARIGASSPFFGVTASGNRLVQEIARRMDASDARSLQNMNQIRVCILRPNQASFNDFNTVGLVPGATQAIPNDNLPTRSKAPGGSSGLSIHDANILHLRVSYYYDTHVPFMNLFDDTAPAVPNDPHLPGETSFSKGILISSETAVVMQTHAALNSANSSIIAGTSNFVPCP